MESALATPPNQYCCFLFKSRYSLPEARTSIMAWTYIEDDSLRRNRTGLFRVDAGREDLPRSHEPGRVIRSLCSGHVCRLTLGSKESSPIHHGITLDLEIVVLQVGKHSLQFPQSVGITDSRVDVAVQRRQPRLRVLSTSIAIR